MTATAIWRNNKKTNCTTWKLELMVVSTFILYYLLDKLEEKKETQLVD